MISIWKSTEQSLNRCSNYMYFSLLIESKRFSGALGELFKEVLLVYIVQFRLMLQLLGVEVSDVVKDLLVEQVRWLGLVNKNEPEVDTVDQVLVLVFDFQRCEKRLDSSNHIPKHTYAQHLNEQGKSHFALRLWRDITVSD